MANKTILNGFDELTDRLLASVTESERVKKQVQQLVEENIRLKLENRKLQELVYQLETERKEDLPSLSQKSKSYVEGIYNEGFHVCNSFYGQSRESVEDCMYCIEFLYKD